MLFGNILAINLNAILSSVILFYFIKNTPITSQQFLEAHCACTLMPLCALFERQLML